MDLTLTLSDAQVAAHQTLYDVQVAGQDPENPLPDFATWLNDLLMMSVEGVTIQQTAIADAATFSKYQSLPQDAKDTITASIDSAITLQTTPPVHPPLQ